MVDSLKSLFKQVSFKGGQVVPPATVFHLFRISLPVQASGFVCVVTKNGIRYIRINPSFPSATLCASITSVVTAVDRAFALHSDNH